MKSSFVVLGSLLLPLMCAAQELLFNNAVKGGLTAEGLRTKPRPGGGDYSELFPDNAAAGASFRRTTYWLADDFEVTASRWRVKRITAWAFQDNLHYPSINQGFIEIHRDRYDGPLVAVADWFKSEMTDIYRIFTGRPNDMFQCQRLTFVTDTVLTPGKYWIVMAALGVVNVNGPWSPFLTPTNALTVPGANAFGRLTGTHIYWKQLFDAGSFAPLDLPFWIDGDKLPIAATPGNGIAPPPDPLAALSSTWPAGR